MASRLESFLLVFQNAVQTAQINTEFTLNDFDVTTTYRPEQPVKDLSTDGQLWIVGTVSDQELHDRARTFKEQLAVRCGLQYPIQKAGLTGEYDEVSNYVETAEDIKDYMALQMSAKINSIKYSWLSTIADKDENGLPLNYQGMRDANLFEAYWTMVFISTVPNRFYT